MLKDKLWLWGQTPGAHHFSGEYKLPGVNKMTPLEGMEYFDINNLCRVKMSIDADKPFAEDDQVKDCKGKIVLSILGAGGCGLSDSMHDVINVAADNENVVAGIMDDFVSPSRMEVYTPEILRERRIALHTALNRPLEFWSVIYERDLDMPIESRVREFDVTTFWTWYGKNLASIDENIKKISDMSNGRLMLGVYMYDYGDCKTLDNDVMLRQLDFVYEKLAKNEIEGMILCSNCIADIGLPTVPLTKKWIAENLK